MPKKKVTGPIGASPRKANGKNSTSQSQVVSTEDTTYTTNHIAKTGRPSLGNKLKVLNAEIAKCTKCTLCLSNKYKVLDKVIYDKLLIPTTVEELSNDFYLFVGDYPTEVEDILLKPFSDKQGKYLRDLISSFLPPEKYLVVNSIICSPTSSFRIGIENQLTCSHNLLSYINTLKPRTIFSVGKVPARLLKKLNLPFIELPSQDAVSTSELQRQRFKLLLSKHLELQGTN